VTCGDAPIVSATIAQLLACAPKGLPLWTVFVAPTVVLLSMAVTAIVAWLTIGNARLIARQKATLDLIEKVESADHYRILNETFSALRKDRGFLHLNDPTHDDRPVRRAVVDYLNHYEIVSIGLRRRILDEKTYKDWMHGAFVRDWNAAADFIQRERWKWDADADAWTYRGSIWAFYQAVACAWSDDAVRLTEASSRPPVKPAGPGDEALPEVAGTPIEGASSETVDNPNP